VAYQTLFRPAGWLYVILIVGDLIATLGGVLAYVREESTWWIAGSAALSLGFTVGIVDLAVSRIELTNAELRITELHRRVAVPKRDIASAKVEGGSVFLQLQDGRWCKVPDTGRNSLAMVNSIRAWLKDT
jgi:hypothetical protein